MKPFKIEITYDSEDRDTAMIERMILELLKKAEDSEMIRGAKFTRYHQK